jgi:hypothetical protein
MKSAVLLRRAAHYLRWAPAPDSTPLEVKGEPKETVVVRRGLSENYYFFLDVFAKHNNVDMIIDRRTSERRRLPREVPTDQRRSDRRSDVKAPVVPRDDFFVVRHEDSEKD